ncbi:hypothetical protein K504DRAFT_469175 [Pleomassaria siparia CBS 279.74]|uniref:F-box domain-containing protein n=1 Tax=Pleomassaria siparia CBS 279.74 TaxID=1314801 RepID=A0A6G1KPI6_9PLEO|nr:hypothetical protein K504DRAFT_469175 [Pleomassaria siparia CBS 279.74]
MTKSPTPTLISLPPELILEIGDHLPPDGILSLKFTHPILNGILPLLPRLRNTTLSTCARFAIRTYLSRTDPKPTHIRCILCKTTYPANIFNSSSSPACQPLSFTDTGSRPEVVELPRRFCACRHVGRLAKLVHTERGGRNEWVSRKRDMCMHCGVVKGWGTCNCTCDSCGTRIVRTYTRFLNNETECRSFKFWRRLLSGEGTSPHTDHPNGQLWVRETCASPGATDPRPVVDLRVHYEDEMSGDSSIQTVSVLS